MRRLTLLTTAAVLSASACAFWYVADRRADLREAEIEARNPPLGEIVVVDGRRVHVDIQGQGPDVVLIHGAGGTYRDFTFGLTERLARDYRVLSFDRPGFGWSERISEDLNGPLSNRAESPIQQARHLAQAARQLGADRPLIVGHSYGGAVAMGWALEEPAAGIVILSGATMPWPGSVDWTYRVLGSRAGGLALPPFVSALVPQSYVQNALSGVFAPQPVPEGYLAKAGIMMATRIDTLRANARQVNALRPHVVEMSRRYPEITIPVEILHGTEDRTVYAEVHAEPLATLLSNASLTILEGIGHMPHHGATDDVIEAIHRAASRAGLR
jgi:pimeloyl-ACP methyl ester carboxylesterase